MVPWFACAYLFSLAATLTFLAGASALNEHWDRESARALRLAALYSSQPQFTDSLNGF